MRCYFLFLFQPVVARPGLSMNTSSYIALVASSAIEISDRALKCNLLKK